MTTLRERMLQAVVRHTVEAWEPNDLVSAILALFRDEAPPNFEQESDSPPVCSECGTEFSWNENSDQDDPAPLCDTCARQLAPEVNGLRAARLRLEAERAELQRRLEESEANYRFMVERAANEKLDGYRELGQRAADAERERDAALSELRAGSMRLAVEALRAQLYVADPDGPGPIVCNAVANWLKAEARKAGASV